MKDPITTPGKTYAVTSPNGCTVTTEDGMTLAEVEAGKQGYFVAVSGKVQLSDDSAILTQLFKLAPYQKLRLLGVVGGNGGLPAGYKRVEYLEYVSGQSLNFDSIAGANFRQEAKILITETAPAKVTFWIRGSYFYQWQLNTKGANSLTLGSEISAGTYELGRRYDFIYSIDENMYQHLEYDGKKYDFEGVSDVIKPDEFYNWQFPRNDTRYMLFARLYGLKLSNSQMGKEMKMIPCLDETGAPCVFDLVSRKAFYNKGAGDFLYPTERTTFALRRVLPDWGKLTENGLRRLYHAPANYKGELYDYAIENGYKPIVETEQPEDGHWSPRWTETEDEIILEWVETEPPTDEFGLPEEPLT